MSPKPPDTLPPPGAQEPSATVLALPAPAGQADRVLRSLEWTVIRRLDGVRQGDYRSLLRGPGLDLSDLREYQPHDDVRHMDWNVTARLDTPHVRVFNEEREMTAWFLLDLSASIYFGPPGRAKIDSLRGFVGVLARLLTRHGNRVGAVLHAGPSDSPVSASTVLPPGQSRLQVLQLLQRLLQHRAPTHSPGSTAQLLHQLLQQGTAQLRRRCTVFVVSDFISAPGWERWLSQLGHRHDVVAVRLLDPLELELPDLGTVPFRDAETGEHLLVDTHDAGFRRRFERLAAERESQTRAAFLRAGVDTLELRTDDDLLDAMLRFLALRERRLPAFRSATMRRAAVPP